MRQRVRETIRFLKSGIWRIHSRNLPRSKSLLIRHLRVVLLALRGFSADKCSLRASALTFYSILAIVPALAMAFGIAKGFGVGKVFEERVMALFSAHEDIAAKILEFSSSLLENTRGGVMAGVGIVVLLWTVLKVLGHVERSFNEIWGIKRPRTLGRKFTDYLSMVLICPILLVVSGSATVLVTGQVQAVVDRVSLLGFLGPLIMAVLRLLPYCIGWGLFAFVYVFMPNTKVNLSSALLAGVVAGTLYQFVQWVYISFQIGVTRYSAIYGSFAVLPLFLIWLQATWLVVLFGAELAFAHQNVETYEFEPDCLQASRSLRKLLALRIAQMAVRNFAEGRKPATAAEIIHELGIPTRLANDVLYELVGARILTETSGDGDREVAYQPARAIDTLTVSFVLGALEDRGTEEIPFTDAAELHRLSECLRELREAIKRSSGNLPLRSI